MGSKNTAASAPSCRGRSNAPRRTTAGVRRSSRAGFVAFTASDDPPPDLLTQRERLFCGLRQLVARGLAQACSDGEGDPVEGALLGREQIGQHLGRRHGNDQTWLQRLRLGQLVSVVHGHVDQSQTTGAARRHGLVAHVAFQLQPRPRHRQRLRGPVRDDALGLGLGLLPVVENRVGQHQRRRLRGRCVIQQGRRGRGNERCREQRGGSDGAQRCCEETAADHGVPPPAAAASKRVSRSLRPAAVAAWRAVLPAASAADAAAPCCSRRSTTAASPP